MAYDNNHYYKKYLAHEFLYKFNQTLFFTFGALLLYTKTQSILAVLIFGLITKITAILIRSIGFKFSLNILNRFGLMKVMSIGVFIEALAYSTIYFIDPLLTNFYLILFSLAVFKQIGHSFYINISNSILHKAVGNSHTPGRFASGVSIVKLLSGILSALTGYILNIQGNFLFLFLIGSIAILASIIPLYGLKFKKIKIKSFKECLKKISIPAFIANVNPEHELKVTALPIIIMLLYSSIDVSIWISAVVAISTIAIAYIAGIYKDGRKNWFTLTALIINVIVWLRYGFVSSQIEFIVLGAILGLSGIVLTIGREAKLSREIVNTGTPIESSIIIEFARGIGMAISFLILIPAFLITGTIPQKLLTLGALFILTKGIYALKDVDGFKE